MSWWRAWRSKTKPVLSIAKQRRVNNLAAAKAPDASLLSQQRFVVLDLESSGLNTLKDDILSIGAVAIEHGAIPLGKQFSCTLRRENHQVTESVLIHELAPSQIAAGIAPTTALIRLLEFIGDSPILAFHSDFDQRLLTRECKQLLNYNLQHLFYDVALLAPALTSHADSKVCSLDDWTEHFKLTILQRHNASADALVTAEISLVLFHLAKQQAIHSFQELDHFYRGLKRRQQQSFSL